MSHPQGPIILFDGVCNLCNAAVVWLIEHDRKAQFRFASLQSEAARAALGDLDSYPDSIILIDEAGVHTRSTAAMRIAGRLGLPYSLLQAGSILPAFLRDGIYKWIARNRYRWFGRREQCAVPSPDLAARFLDAAERIEVPPMDPATPRQAGFWWCLAIAYVWIYILPFPLDHLDAYQAVWHRVIPWFARLVLGWNITVFPGGSGDTSYNYAETVFDVLLATTAAVLVRGRLPQLAGALTHIGLRYFVGYYLIVYGWAKLVPLQFPSPGPAQLMRTFAEASPMGLVWTMMGASIPYQMLTGAVELLGGLLLLFPATYLPGGLLAVFAMAQVVALNLCFDIPVKLFSSHLLLFSLAIVWRDLGRLLLFTVFRSSVQLAPVPALPEPPGRWRIALVLAKGLLLVLLVPALGYMSYRSWVYSGQQDRSSAFHGFWKPQSMEGFSAEERWLRVGITGGWSMTVQRADGEFYRFRMKVNEAQSQLELIEQGHPIPETYRYRWLAPDQLQLEIAGKTILLRKQPASVSLLLSRGGHWINETPLNR